MSDLFFDPEWTVKVTAPLRRVCDPWNFFHGGDVPVLGGTRPEFRPKSYVFMGRPNEVLADVLRSRGVEPIVAETTDRTASLAEFLTSLRTRADALAGAGQRQRSKG